MPYESSNGRRRDAPRRSQGRSGDGRGLPRGSVNSQGRRQAQARGGSAGQYRSSRGYSLHQHSIHFNNRRGGVVQQVLGNPRAVAALFVVVLLVVVAVIGISSVVRSCSGPAKDQAMSEQDSRVAAGLSTDITDQLVARLNQDELVAKIAASASKIEDERLIKLALREPEALALVAGLTEEEVDLTAKPYGADAAKGAFPKLYDWDQRWGLVTFGKGAMALTGSGPTSLSMAYIGLTGATDNTPADIAASAVTANALDDTYGFAPSFVETETKRLGLASEELSPSGDTLVNVVESGTVVLVQLKSGVFGDDPHWALVVGENLDGSVNINDPTSPEVTARPWDPATVAASAQSFYRLTTKEAEDKRNAEDEEPVEDEEEIYY